MTTTRLIVTTSTQPTMELEARAEVVADRCGAPLARRRGGLPALLDAHRATLAYVVGRDREVVVGAHHRVGLDLGLLHAHRAQGTDHPLLRALGPLPPGAHVLDATLGLAHDALHVAAVAGARVTGIERNPALFSLAEAGLQRLAREGEPAAARIRPVLGDSRVELRAHSPASAVILSPMFDEPRRAPPGFEVLRALAHHTPLGPDWLDATCAAAPRVVLRARRGQPVPDFAVPRLRDVIRGKAVDYWVFGPT